MDIKKHVTLDLYWTTLETIHGTHATVALVESKLRPGELRFAYTRPDWFRWQISPFVAKSFAKTVIEEARRDIGRGDGHLRGARHMVKVFGRQIMKPRFARHRKRLAERREKAQIATLPNYGLF